MAFLIASILFSASILVLFRYFKQWGIDNLQAIIVNYIVAAAIGFASHEGASSLGIIVEKPWFSVSIILGILFIGVFFLFALSSQVAGVAITAVASRMSVVIPVTAAFLLFDETATLTKIFGIALALPAFYLTFKKKRNEKVAFLTLLLPLAIFIGTGSNDLLMKYTEYHYLQDDLFQLLAVVFTLSLVIGVIILLVRVVLGKTVLQTKNIAAGLALGMVNFYSTYFMFRSMEYFDSSVMFPVLNIGVVSLAAFSDAFLFNEKFSTANRIGIGLALLAIVFISIG